MVTLSVILCPGHSMYQYRSYVSSDLYCCCFPSLFLLVPPTQHFLVLLSTFPLLLQELRQIILIKGKECSLNFCNDIIRLKGYNETAKYLTTYNNSLKHCTVIIKEAALNTFFSCFHNKKQYKLQKLQ